MDGRGVRHLRAEIDQHEPLVRVYLTRRELRVLAQHYQQRIENMERILRERDGTPLAKRIGSDLKRVKRRAAELPAPREG
jgi:hypothetical protein